MSDENYNHISAKLKATRIKLFAMFAIFVVPGVILNEIKENIGTNPIYVMSVLLHIIAIFIVFFKFANLKCPSCGEGYFSKYGTPRLFYRFRCVNCGFKILSPNKNEP